MRIGTLLIIEDAYDRLKPSGEMFAFPMVSVVDGPIAAKANGISDKTASVKTTPAAINMASNARDAM